MTPNAGAMISAQSQPQLLRPNLDRLSPVEPGIVVLAFLHGCGQASVWRRSVEKAALPLMPDRGALDVAIASLSSDGFISVTRGGQCRLTAAGRRKTLDMLGPLPGPRWADIVSRVIAPLALGLDPKDAAVRAYASRRDNLETAALARLFGLRASSGLPARAEIRRLLVQTIVTARLPECEALFTETSMQNPSRNPFGRALLLGAAGLKSGNYADAERALAGQALGAGGDTKQDFAELIVRNAVSRGLARPAARAPLPPLTLRGEPRKTAPATPAMPAGSLAEFAATVRSLAKTQETRPYAGRAAIAQVYDAGVERGLDLGTLDAFKARIAEAGRAGLLDLERYDIAGPMDAALRDRSRTAFGRDVRHFIVNEWI